MKTLARILCICLMASVALPGVADAAKRKTRKAKDDTTDVKVEEVGILRNEDVRVVQKNLYVKKGYHEVGFLLTTQPWDPYASGLMAGIDITFNPTERVGVELMIQGGYAWGNGHFKDVTFLSTNAGGQLASLASDAVRQLVGGSLNVVWSPVYAKLAWGGNKVIHFDVYGILGAHGYLAQQLEAGNALRPVVGPSIGVGMKFFLNPKTALKIDLRDHIALEKRAYSGTFTARNNWQFGIGFAFYTGKK